MSGTSKSHPHFVPPAHQNFHWIHGPGREQPLAEFVEFTKDISSGINTCLHIIYASDLVREQLADEEPDELSAPAVGKADAACLFRFSLAAAALLLHVADEKIDEMNVVA